MGRRLTILITKFAINTLALLVVDSMFDKIWVDDF